MSSRKVVDESLVTKCSSSLRRAYRLMVLLMPLSKTKMRGLSARDVYTVKETKKKDFVTLVDAHGKELKINVHANGEKLELGAIGEIELQAGDRLWFRANFWRHQWDSGQSCGHG